MGYKLYKQYRLYGYDYSRNGAYFITIVTKNREHHFGEIINSEMKSSAIGKYIENNFEEIVEKIQHLNIAEFVIMPNHLHFVAVIENNEQKEYQFAVGLRPLIEKSISSFVNHLKGRTKRWCNENGQQHFEWQARFHDRIIRDEKEYMAIANYIQNNVLNWIEDKENL